MNTKGEPTQLTRVLKSLLQRGMDQLPLRTV